VEFMTVSNMAAEHPVVGATITDKEAIGEIMECLDRCRPEGSKFAFEYKLTVHYRNGRVLEVWVGRNGAIVDDKRFALPIDLGALLGNAISSAPVRPSALEPARSALLAAGRLEDTAVNLRSLDQALLALGMDGLPEIREFKKQIAWFREYASGRPYRLTPQECRELVSGIEAYEGTFYSARAELIRRWLSCRPGERGCLTPTYLACTQADFVLDRMGPVFSGHNWKPDRPNDLAAHYIAVVRAYGGLTVAFAEPDDPAAQDFRSQFDRALRSVSPASPSAGKKE
jgi:hypothetical protein